MRRKLLLVISLVLTATPSLFAQEKEPETSFARRKEVYRFSLVASPLHNIEATAIDTTSVYQLLNLEFHRWKISNPQNYSYGSARSGAAAFRALWHFHTILQFVVWPHEGGHWIRHREFGNSFNLGPLDFGEFPAYIGATSTYKSGVTNLEKMMGVIGGPETNNLIALHNQKEMYQRGAFGDDMLFVSLHKLQYIFYLFLYTS
ncbi:MAG: hypothetical protein Q7S68_00410, partial [Deltaproteobacteria bacterium]|nr:hypothetical protein [Deltaproteobacteria bacterium]